MKLDELMPQYDVKAAYSMHIEASPQRVWEEIMKTDFSSLPVARRLMALRTFSSDEPTRLPNMRPISKRSNGSCHRLETAFAQRLLPQPCTPSNRMPFGAGNPNARA